MSQLGFKYEWLVLQWLFCAILCLWAVRSLVRLLLRLGIYGFVLTFCVLLGCWRSVKERRSWSVNIS